MKLRLQTRFSLLIVALILVLVGVLSGGLLYQAQLSSTKILNTNKTVVEQALIDQIEREGKALASTLAENLINHLYFFRMDLIRDVAAAAKNQHGVVYVYVHNASGLIVHDGTETMEAYGLDMNDDKWRETMKSNGTVAWFADSNSSVLHSGSTNEVLLSSGIYHVAAPIILGSEIIGGVRIGVSLATVSNQISKAETQLSSISEAGMKNLVLIAASATVFLIGVGIISALILGRWLSRPIVALADTAREIGKGRYDVGVAEDRSDEIGDLALSIKEMAQDIAERDRLQVQLAQHHKVSALDDMVGGIAHNFNNLMQPIQVLAPMVRDNLPADSKERQRMDVVIQCCDDARQLVSRISEFSREAPFHRETVDLFAFVRKELDLIAPIVPSSIQLDTALDENVGRAVVDVTELQTVLLNLVNNATDAIDGHNGRLAISLSRSQSTPIERIPDTGMQNGPFAVLTVADDGKGIAPDALDRIFDPFFTTKSVGEGTGLGLSTAYGIITRLGGTITATSTPGEETRFDVFIPLASPDRSA